MKLPISITVLASVLLVVFFVKDPAEERASADTIGARTSTTDSHTRTSATTRAVGSTPVRTAPTAFGAVPAEGPLPKTLPAVLPATFYEGASTEDEKQWYRAKTQFRLTVLDAVHTCLQGQDVGTGTVDVEVHFDNSRGRNAVTDVTSFPHDNPNAAELNERGKERVLTCVRDALGGRDFEMSFPPGITLESVHRLAIKLPLSNDPVYEYLRGGAWNE